MFRYNVSKFKITGGVDEEEHTKIGCVFLFGPKFENKFENKFNL